MPRPPFAVVRRGQQPFHQPFIGVRIRILQKRLHLGRRGRQSVQIEEDPPDQRPPIRLRREPQPFFRQLRRDVGINRVPPPGRGPTHSALSGRTGHPGRLLSPLPPHAGSPQWLEGPVRLGRVLDRRAGLLGPEGARIDPVPEETNENERSDAPSHRRRPGTGQRNSSRSRSERVWFCGGVNSSGGGEEAQASQGARAPRPKECCYLMQRGSHAGGR